MNSLAGIDMGRILLDLSNEVIKQLDDLEVQRNLPRADLLREAVDQYLINQSQTARTSVPGIRQSYACHQSHAHNLIDVVVGKLRPNRHWRHSLRW